MKTYEMMSIALLAAVGGILQVLHGIIGIPTGFGMTVDLVAFPALLAFFLMGFEASLYVLVITCTIITLIAPSTWLGASMKFSATLPMILVPALYMIRVGRGFSIGRFAIAFFFALFAAMGIFVIMGTSYGAGVGLQSLNVTLYTVPRFEAFGAELVKGEEVSLGNLLLGLLPVGAMILFSFILLFLWKKCAKHPSSLLKDWKAMGVVLLIALIVRGTAMVVSNYYYAGPVFYGIPPEKLMALVPWYLIFGWNAVQGVLEFLLAWYVAFRFKFVERYGTW